MAEVLQVEDRLRSFVCILFESVRLQVQEMTVSFLTCMDVGIERHSPVRVAEQIVGPVLMNIFLDNFSVLETKLHLSKYSEYEILTLSL